MIIQVENWRGRRIIGSANEKGWYKFVINMAWIRAIRKEGEGYHMYAKNYHDMYLWGGEEQPAIQFFNDVIHENVNIILGGNRLTQKPPTGFGIDASIRKEKYHYSDFA